MRDLLVTRRESSRQEEPLLHYSYTYDSQGNITRLEGRGDLTGSTGQARMEYDRGNRLIRYNGKEVRYDGRGNMVYGPLNVEMTEFEYGGRNRLVRAGGTAYEYDAEDRRTAAVTDGYWEEYVTDPLPSLPRVLEIRRMEPGGEERACRRPQAGSALKEKLTPIKRLKRRFQIIQRD